MGTTSYRKQVLDTIYNALDGSTYIQKVTHNIEAWWDWDIQDFPGATIMETDSDVRRLAFDSTTFNDRENVMNLTIRGYVHDLNGDVHAKREELARVIDTKIYASTALKAKVLDVNLYRIERDDGTPENFGIVNMDYKITYHYKHATP